MKKNFLSLRKLGLVLLAAGSMAMYSCGGDEAAAEAEAEALVEDLVGDLEEVMEEATEEVEEVAEEMTEEMTEDMEGEHKCEDGKCGEGEAETEGEH